MKVKSLDSIVDDVENPNYLVYIEGEDHIKFGAMSIDFVRDTANKLIPYIIMRESGISMLQALEVARNTKPTLVITHTASCIDHVQEYKIFN